MDKVVWGVVGTAKIGLKKVIPGLQKSALIDVRAIASRSIDHARAAARQLDIAVACGSYEELLADPQIEAVYVPLPNHLHVPLALQAVRAGKHVLCEKPIALNADEAATLREAAPRVHVMEAFMVRFHPQWLLAQRLVREGRIGTLHGVQVWFSYFNDDPANIRNQPAIGGGALYDIGCYAVVAGRFFFGTEPLRAVALADRDPVMGADRLFSGLLDFGAGRQLDFTVGMQSSPYQRVHLHGSAGRIEIVVPFNAAPDVPAVVQVEDARAQGGAGLETITLPAADQYMLQGEAFSRAVRGEAALPYGIEDAVANMRVIDALYRSERSGAWERP